MGTEKTEARTCCEQMREAAAESAGGALTRERSYPGQIGQVVVAIRDTPIPAESELSRLRAQVEEANQRVQDAEKNMNVLAGDLRAERDAALERVKALEGQLAAWKSNSDDWQEQVERIARGDAEELSELDWYVELKDTADAAEARIKALEGERDAAVDLARECGRLRRGLEVEVRNLTQIADDVCTRADAAEERERVLREALERIDTDVDLRATFKRCQRFVKRTLTKYRALLKSTPPSPGDEKTRARETEPTLRDALRAATIEELGKELTALQAEAASLRDALERKDKALRAAFEAIPGNDGHDGDEESGEHFPNCKACEREAALAQIEEALSLNRCQVKVPAAVGMVPCGNALPCFVTSHAPARAALSPKPAETPRGIPAEDIRLGATTEHRTALAAESAQPGPRTEAEIRRKALGDLEARDKKVAADARDAALEDVIAYLHREFETQIRNGSPTLLKSITAGIRGTLASRPSPAQPASAPDDGGRCDECLHATSGHHTAALGGGCVVEGCGCRRVAPAQPKPEERRKRHTICVCDSKEPHYVPPSLGEPGFYVCEPEPTPSAPPSPEPSAAQRLDGLLKEAGLTPYLHLPECATKRPPCACPKPDPKRVTTNERGTFLGPQENYQIAQPSPEPILCAGCDHREGDHGGEGRNGCNVPGCKCPVYDSNGAEYAQPSPEKREPDRHVCKICGEGIYKSPDFDWLHNGGYCGHGAIPATPSQSSGSAR